jgi:hypothetical protein
MLPSFPEGQPRTLQRGPLRGAMLFISATWLAAEALAALTIAHASLVLTLAGCRPAAAPVIALGPAPHPPALLPPVPPLELLKLVELRSLARAAGLPRLARSGRRVELTGALAVVP